MARVLKWKQKVALAFVTVLISTVGALSLGTHSASAASGQYDSQFVTGPKGLGLELMVRRPYARLVRASFTPVSLPLVAGAYIAMAGAGGAPPAPPAAEDVSSCPVCHTATAPCCTGGNAAVVAQTCCSRSAAFVLFTNEMPRTLNSRSALAQNAAERFRSTD